MIAAATVAAAAAQQVQCMRCTITQVVPAPPEAVLVIRFCVAEYPRHLCMFCCSCSICRNRCIEGYAKLYLHLGDHDFDEYMQRQNGEVGS